MSILHMQTDEVKYTAQICIQMLSNCQEKCNELNIRADSLESDWYGNSGWRFSEELKAIAKHLANLVNTGEDLFVRAQQEAAEWELLNSKMFTPSLNHQFGMVIAGGLPILNWFAPIVVLPGAAFRVAFELLKNWLPNWLSQRLLGVKTQSDSTGFIPRAWVEEDQNISSKDRLSDTVKSATPSAQPASVTENKQTDQIKYHYKVPTQSQIGLAYQNSKNLYGCTPTSASMVMNYWHSVDEKNQMVNAQDLLNENVSEKEFTSAGMSYDEIIDDFQERGYQADLYHSPYGSDAATSKVAMETALKDGPVMAVVRTGITTNGYPHSVVVTGIHDGGYVFLNDPLTGTERKVSWDVFDSSWGSNFGKSYPSRIYLTIQPKTN